jgi:hypothetical protein
MTINPIYMMKRTSLEALQILVAYIDRVVIARQSVVMAIGVDTQRARHLL